MKRPTSTFGGRPFRFVTPKIKIPTVYIRSNNNLWDFIFLQRIWNIQAAGNYRKPNYINGCGLLASFVETTPFSGGFILSVTTIQTKLGRPNMLWSAFLSGSQMLQSSIYINAKF